MKKHEEAKPKEKNTKQNKTKQYRVHFIGFPVLLSLALSAMTTDDDNEYGRKAMGLEKQELYAYIMLF